MKQIVTIFIMLFGATFLNAQLGVGEWRMHVSPYSTHNLTQAKGAIYVALEKGILEYEVSTVSFNKFLYNSKRHALLRVF